MDISLHRRIYIIHTLYITQKHIIKPILTVQKAEAAEGGGSRVLTPPLEFYPPPKLCLKCTYF